jgi:hypothetical protein
MEPVSTLIAPAENWFSKGGLYKKKKLVVVHCHIVDAAYTLPHCARQNHLVDCHHHLCPR